MNKYNILDHKLELLLVEVDKLLVEYQDDYIKEYLEKYKNHINRIHGMIVNKTLENSKQGLLGIQRAISESDTLCSNEKLYQLACDVERYYAEECKNFE
ncbi:hypothetical protein [Anaeromicropila herbilytica]|uniref:Uncharacterized protein n=1 Tax=Anaeromicropila herbilytica TaxID=2785025 RepID=A0A7R7EPG8_9FIRM|nr:hypothetical protein [Anaeromicropila herbilytica]BCN32371.1 hypothetical protein bsdtb5_36660 [Anaeromicropila herbilytica]